MYRLIAEAVYVVFLIFHIMGAVTMVMVHSITTTNPTIIGLAVIGYVVFIFITIHVVYRLLPEKSKVYWNDNA